MKKISTPFYKTLDLLLVFLCCSVAYWIRFDTPIMHVEYMLPVTVLLISITSCLEITDYYNSGLAKEKVVAAALAFSLASSITIACLYLTKTGEYYSRIWFSLSVLFSFSSILLSRVVIKKVLHLSHGTRHIIILGNGDKLANEIQENLSDANGLNVIRTFDEIASLDDLKQAQEFIRDRQDSGHEETVSEVWVTYTVFNKIEQNMLDYAFQQLSIKIVYIPIIPKSYDSLPKIDYVYGVPTINSNLSDQLRFKQLIKFISDQVFSWLGLIILSPLLLIICILIKLDSKGPIIYKQERHGFSGKRFLVWKFRTMYTTDTTSEFKQATKNDSRITRVGGFLRKTSLDELPQLVNVILGDMSIVGPRPQPINLNEEYQDKISYFMKRHNVKPGITGLAQINGARGETPTIGDMSKRIELDLQYITQWSLLLDLSIILKTVHHVLTTDKAF